jgi:hypothetical protein
LRIGPVFCLIYQLGSHGYWAIFSLPTASELIFYQDFFGFRTHLNLKWRFQVL